MPLKRGLAWSLFLLAGTLFYYWLFRGRIHTSEDATGVLAAQDMLRGNWHLSGWLLPRDHFWGADLWVLSLLSFLGPSTPQLLVLGPACVWAGLLALSYGLLQLSPTRVSRHQLLILAVLLGLPIIQPEGAGGAFAMTSFHLATVAYLFATLISLEKARRSRLWFLPAGLCTALAQLADPFILFVGVIPIGAASLWMARHQILDRRHHLASAATMLGAAFLGSLANAWLQSAGLVVPGALEMSFSSFAGMVDNVVQALGAIFLNCGSTFFGQQIKADNLLLILVGLARFPLALALLWSLAVTLREAIRLPTPLSGGFYLDSLLASCALFNFLAAVASNRMTSGADRYLIPCALLGSVLLARSRHAAPLRQYLLLPLSLSCVLALVTIFDNFLKPLQPISPKTARLVRVLRENGLHYGYAHFWDSNLITVASDGDICIRYVGYSSRRRRLVPGPWANKLAWFDQDTPRGPELFVLSRDNPEANEFRTEQVEASLGPALRKIRHEDYWIFLYPATTRIPNIDPQEG